MWKYASVDAYDKTCKLVIRCWQHFECLHGVLSLVIKEPSGGIRWLFQWGSQTLFKWCLVRCKYYILICNFWYSNAMLFLICGGTNFGVTDTLNLRWFAWQASLSGWGSWSFWILSALHEHGIRGNFGWINKHFVLYLSGLKHLKFQSVCGLCGMK